MVTPVINNIVPFDAGVGTVFTFQYTGGITDSYFEIFDVNNAIIYDSRDDARLGISQLKQRTIPSATNDYVDNNGTATNPLSKMVNDAQYYIQLTVINGEETSTSQKRLFRCITTPLLSVFNNDGTGIPLGKSYILTSANLELYTTYTQVFVNNSIYEDLNCYQFILYDNSYQKIYTSDVYYNLTDDEGMPIYTKISGLEEKRYFLKVIGKTINGYVIDHDFIAIDVKYKASPQKTTLLVENCLDEGFVKIGTNIHALLYRLKYSPAKFVDDVIQLRDNWLEYYDGLTIDGDYVAYVRFKNPNYNTNLVRISGEGHNVYMNCYKHDTYMSMVEIEETYGDILLDKDVVKDSYLYFDLRIYTKDKVEMLVSDKFSVQKMEDAWFNAFIVRKGSKYSFLVIPDKYKMIYMLYDGLNDSRNPLNYQEGETLYLYDATKRGNTFKGWYSSSSFTYSTKITSPFTAPDYSMTIYAKWIPNTYNISYNLPTGATQEQIRYLKWNNIDFEKRVAVMDDKILYFNKDVRVLLENERKRRSEEGIDDSGYVFRGRIQKYYNKSTPISKSTVSNWDTEIGQYIDMPNFKHNHIRHTAIQRLLSASGSVGMTSILMNQPYLTSQAKYFINDDINNDLLQEYKDICEI